MKTEGLAPDHDPDRPREVGTAVGAAGPVAFVSVPAPVVADTAGGVVGMVVTGPTVAGTDGAGATTSISWATVAAWPESSSTARFTVNLPGAVNVWVTFCVS